MKIWNRICGEPWAITEGSLQTILEIAQRENESPEAIAAKLGRNLQNSYNVTIRDNVAIIPITGPLFRYANIFSSISGATSYELIAKDLNLALENPNIKAIILDIDSPGGEVNGVSELSNMIYEARGTKPIIAYASGDACSGAYWIASAADKIYVSETSALGSIGVVGVYNNKTKEENKIEIISSQSPYKRIDPSSDEGRLKIQSRIDAMAEVFIENISRNRNVSTEEVKNSFGKGDVFIGKQAVDAGLADNLSSLEQIIKQFSTIKENEYMDIKTIETENPELMAEIKAQGMEEEKLRLREILQSEQIKGKEELAYEMALNTNIGAAEIIKILAKAPMVKKEETISSFEKVMASIPNPEIDPSNDEITDTIDAVAKRIAAA